MNDTAEMEPSEDDGEEGACRDEELSHRGLDESENDELT